MSVTSRLLHRVNPSPSLLTGQGHLQEQLVKHMSRCIEIPLIQQLKCKAEGEQDSCHVIKSCRITEEEGGGGGWRAAHQRSTLEDLGDRDRFQGSGTRHR